MKTILIVDDDRNLRRLYRDELEPEGYRIVLAANGREALDIVSREVPDLVLMDIKMPGMDGLEAMAHLLKEHGGVPILLHTAYASYQDNFLAWAAEGYLIKSSDLDPLKQKIREILAA
jgi:two-component system response regulator (stage 0 sporulation protein F)